MRWAVVTAAASKNYPTIGASALSANRGAITGAAALPAPGGETIGAGGSHLHQEERAAEPWAHIHSGGAITGGSTLPATEGAFNGATAPSNTNWRKRRSPKAQAPPVSIGGRDG